MDLSTFAHQISSTDTRLLELVPSVSAAQFCLQQRNMLSIIYTKCLEMISFMLAKMDNVVSFLRVKQQSCMKINVGDDVWKLNMEIDGINHFSHNWSLQNQISITVPPHLLWKKIKKLILSLVLVLTQSVFKGSETAKVESYVQLAVCYASSWRTVMSPPL